MTAFYNDVDAVIARRAVDQLGFQSYASMTQPLTIRRGSRSRVPT